MRKFMGLICGAILSAAALQAHAQTSASHLHDALHLSAQQEGAWASYQQTVDAIPQQQRARAEQASSMLPSLPTPQRLALIRAQMEADLAAFDQSARATSAFYATLTPDQQRTFDRETAPPAQGRGGTNGRGY